MANEARPTLTFWQIWNMCFGFLGLQFVFALQNANVSRIFQTLGADLDAIPSLWIAAPLTGLLVQPIIGYWSDRTWTRLGRRRPYFLVGAILASLALLAMPRSGALWIAAGVLWLLDASINISMEPFRAFVGDQLGPSQRPTGYSMQSFFIGTGAVAASALPWLFAKAGVSNHGADAAGHALVPDTLYYSFDLGALVLLAAVCWTVLRTREYPPETLHAFGDSAPESSADAAAAGAASGGRMARACGWTALGLIAVTVVAKYRLDRQLYLVSGMALAWGVAQLLHARFPGRGFFGTIMDDMENMPRTMRRLVPVQFFSWLALFSMWLYTTPAVTQVHFHSSDPATAAYNNGADWVGVLFGAYNGFAALAALVIPRMVRLLGLQRSHLVNVWLGGAGLISMALIRDPDWLLASMLGVGFAWASILSLPYALLSDSLPARKMGVYMGIFNFFIVIPQLVAASVLGALLKAAFGGRSIEVLVLGGACFLIAGLLSLRVPLHTSHARPA